MADTVAEQLADRGLDGLVCNAGVGAGGPIEFLDRDEMSIPIEVNLYGSIYCAQAFLPLLRRARGRERSLRRSPRSHGTAVSRDVGLW